MTIDINVKNEALVFSDKVTCMKVVNYMHQAVIKSYLGDTAEVCAIIKRLRSKVFIICKRGDIKYFLESRIFIYRNQNNVRILRKTGSPRCLSVAQHIVKIPVTSFASKGTKSLKEITDRLRLKNILGADDKILV